MYVGLELVWGNFYRFLVKAGLLPIVPPTFVSVDSIADLKALTTRPDIVFTRGYNTENDGGGGPPWQWVAASTATIDDFMVVSPTGSPSGRYIRQLQAGAAVSPKWAGCGLGSANDSAQFTAVLNFGNPVDASGCTLPLRDLVVTSSTCPGIFSDGSGQITPASGSSSTTTILSIRKSDFYVSNIFFNLPYSGDPANPPACDKGLDFRSVAGSATGISNIRVENCRFYGGRFGMAITGRVSDLNVIGNHFENTWLEGLLIDGPIDGHIDRNTVISCAFDNTGLASAGVRIGASSQIQPGKRLTFSDNIVYRCGLGNAQEGVDLASNVLLDVTADNNQIIECGNGGFEVKTPLASASFTGTISGTTLSVSAVTGTIVIGQIVAGAGVTVGTMILSGSGSTWTVDISQTVGPVAMTSDYSPDTYGRMAFNGNLIILGGTATLGIGFNLHLTGSPPANGKACKVILAGNFVCCDTMPASGSTFYGISISGFDDVALNGNFLLNLSRGITIAPNGNVSAVGSRIYVSGGQINASSYGIQGSGTGTLTDVRIIGVDVIGGTRGIAFDSDSLVTNDLHISACRIENTSAGAALELRGVSGAKVTKNDLISPSSNNVILQTTASTNVTFSQNGILNNGTGNAFTISVGTGIKILNNICEIADASRVVSGAGTYVAAGNVRGTATADPSATVAGSLGDIVQNSTPSVGAPTQWVCTTAGNAGAAVYSPQEQLGGLQRVVPVVLGAPVALNNVVNYFNGPTTGSIGAAGQVWLVFANFTVSQSGAGPDYYQVHIWDGAAIQGDEQIVTSIGIGTNVAGSCFAIVTLAAATTFTLRAKDASSVTGSLLPNGTSIGAVRLV